MLLLFYFYLKAELAYKHLGMHLLVFEGVVRQQQKKKNLKNCHLIVVEVYP